MKELSCFVVSDGRRGIENQALGLAEAVGRMHPVRILAIHLDKGGDPPDPGPIAPDLWIGCGRAAVKAAPGFRRAHPKAVMVYVQDPRTHHEVFDLIAPPRHDRLAGRNVLPVLGSPNRIHADRLEEARNTFSAELAGLRRPRAAFLIGGDSKHHRFSRSACDYLLGRIEQVRQMGLSLMITTSRRTPPHLARALAERYAGEADVWLHQGDGANPYFAFLAGADFIFVTEDSTNMLTEAAATGAPVFKLGVDGSPGKFRQLYAGLEGHGALRPWLGTLQSWDYPPLNETERAASRVLEILAAKTEV
ncbi:MAG: mitochondrial fission ELM1 family protein [Oceanicaulis sp.]